MKRKYGVLVAALLLVIGGVTLYTLITPHDVEVRQHGSYNLKVQKKDKLRFVQALVGEYARMFDEEIDPKFKASFILADKCSAWYVVSSYGESLVYVYRSEKPRITVDYVDVPAQLMLTHGLVDLNIRHKKSIPKKS